MTDNSAPVAEPIEFQAEIRQLLDILIHSLYTQKEIFLRELISNASDALNRIQFEMLTNRDVRDMDAELALWVKADEEKRTLTIRDSGVGMTREDMITDLGTIAHSGARAFLEAAGDSAENPADIIGQFGVGFYSVFMVADEVRVTSRSFEPDAEAFVWAATSGDAYTIEPVETEQRGTTIEVKLNEDAAEFAKEYRIREIIRKYSDFVAYPIYLGSGDADRKKDGYSQANRQTAIWRQSVSDVQDEQYDDFYKQLTLDFEPPLTRIHYVTDAPVQMYALLFLPKKADPGLLSPRREDGLKLYIRKVLIQEYSKDLLPQYFRFVEGVVDSEDLPLNVSREAVQDSPVIARMKKALTRKVIDSLRDLASEEPEQYEVFWKEYGRFIKEGVSSDHASGRDLYSLLRFNSTEKPEDLTSLVDYVERMKAHQKDIYFLIGDDHRSVQRSPHLDYFKKNDYEVLTLTDPMDSFMLMGLQEFEGKKLKNVAAADTELPAAEEKELETEGESLAAGELARLIAKFKAQLGERVTDVVTTDRLTESPARLVDPDGAVNQEMQRVYRMLEQDFEVPKKILELNPRHSLLRKMATLPEPNELLDTCVEQIYESALLIEGLHPDPASMIPRIQEIMEAAAAVNNSE